MKNREIKEVAQTAAQAGAAASWPQTRAVLRVILIVLAVAVTLWIIVKLTGVILLLVLSVFFAYLVYPLVEFLRRPIPLGKRKVVVPRTAAISLAYFVIVAAIVLGIYLLAPRLGSQFPEFTEQARGYWAAVGDRSQGWVEYFRTHRMPGPVLDAVNKAVPSVIEKVSLTVSEVLGSITHWLIYIPWLVLIPILSFFFLKDADTFRRSALQMLPKGRWRWRGDEFFQDINSALAAYIRAQLTACLFIGIVCAIGFTVLGLPSPLVLGLMAGILEFIPLVGPLLIAIIAVVAALLHSGSFSALMVLLFLAVLRIVQDYVVYPRLIGQGIHLHPLAVIIAILSGAELAGIAGIFLAIPVVAILTVSYRHWLEHRGSEGLADLLEPATADSDTTPTDDLLSTDITDEHAELVAGELEVPQED